MPPAAGFKFQSDWNRKDFAAQSQRFSSTLPIVRRSERCEVSSIPHAYRDFAPRGTSSIYANKVEPLALHPAALRQPLVPPYNYDIQSRRNNPLGNVQASQIVEFVKVPQIEKQTNRSKPVTPPAPEPVVVPTAPVVVLPAAPAPRLSVSDPAQAAPVSSPNKPPTPVKSAASPKKKSVVLPPTMNEEEFNVVLEMNRVRANPPAYAPELEALRPHFKGLSYSPPGEITLVTNEGMKAVDDCITELQRLPPLVPFIVSAGLERAAEVHACDIGGKGITAHQGSDGSMPNQRMERFGKIVGKAGENLAFGGRSAKEHVQQLLIDDGVASRGHRKNILSVDFEKVGVAITDHSSFGTCCVQTFAKDFENNPDIETLPRPERVVIDPRPLKEHAFAAAKIQRVMKCKLAKSEARRRRERLAVTQLPAV